jgi:hypothetical protein
VIIASAAVGADDVDSVVVWEQYTRKLLLADIFISCNADPVWVRIRVKP